MSGPHVVSPGPISSQPEPRRRWLRFSVGFWLTLAGNLMALVAFFSPWFEVFKENDPTYPFPRRGYSPWMVLASGQPDSMRALAAVFLLLILGMVMSCLVAMLARAAHVRPRAILIACIFTALSLTLVAVVAPAIPFDLSFSWPFLSSTAVYGVYLAAAGFVITLIGLLALNGSAARGT